MQTITFYSYKGGTGRSLALANAARYLARLEFKVVVVDFDLEAPGLHYKFSANADGKPLPVRCGIVDYIHSFVDYGNAPISLRDIAIIVEVPGVGKPLIQLIPAGHVPSAEYWSKLASINWHQLFYSPDAVGVRIFLELKNRILDEFNPDFLLIDSRTGITEMGGVATALLADKVICLVLPTLENLEGARAVLRSLKRSQRDIGMQALEIIVALSRLPESDDQAVELAMTEQILAVLNEPAEDLRDSLACSEVFILHSEAGLQLRETLRIGGTVSPDDSILLRDYLRLFAVLVPKGLIEPKFGQLVERAKEKIWDDPEAAMKEVEELADSFGHPENYRALLRFYEVRNVSGIPVVKRAQRLWELTRDSADPAIWQALRRNYGQQSRWASRRGEWSASIEFVEAVWRDAGRRDPEFAMKLAQTCSDEDKDSHAADLLLETMKASEPTASLVSKCIFYLDWAKRGEEADNLVLQSMSKFANELEFIDAWARHGARAKNSRTSLELIKHPSINFVKERNPLIAARLYLTAGLEKEAIPLAELALRNAVMDRHGLSESEVIELGSIFVDLELWSEFEEKIRGTIPGSLLEEVRKRVGAQKRGTRLPRSVI